MKSVKGESQNILKELKEQSLKTSNEMAKILKTSVARYNRLEKGETELKLEEIQNIAHFFKYKSFSIIDNGKENPRHIWFKKN